MSRYIVRCHGETEIKDSGERSEFLFGALSSYPYPRRIGLTAVLESVALKRQSGPFTLDAGIFCKPAQVVIG